MSISIKEIKRRAREVLLGRFGLPMAAFLICQTFLLFGSLPFELVMGPITTPLQDGILILVNLLIGFIGGLMYLGSLKIHLELHTFYHASKEEQKPLRLSNVFYCFKHQPDRYLIAEILMFLLYVLAASPLILLYVCYSSHLPLVLAAAGIPAALLGLFLLLSYELAMFILLEDETLSIKDAFRASRNLMRGHRFSYLGMWFGFLLLFVLSVLSFGLGFLWVIPYYQQTITQFYLSRTTSECV